MMNFFRPRALIGLSVLIAAILAATTATAEVFESFNGRFHFAYPDSWVQIDYVTAEVYLTRGNPDQEVDFEAVFSDKKAFAVFQGQYLILTVDTVGPLTAEQRDSVLNNMSREFNRPVKEVTSDAFMMAACRDSIVFDRADGRVVVETEVPGDKSGTRVNLLVMKFYDQGIANFYFYCPAIEVAANLPVFREMVMSFSTEQLQPATPAGPIKVADIESGRNKTRNYSLFFGGPILIVFLILIIQLRKKRKRSQP